MNANELNDDPPFKLMQRQPKRLSKHGKPRMVLSKADIAILARYIHREDFTREELAKRFGLTVRQLKVLITEQGWARKEGEDDAEDNIPLGPDPVPCPFPPGSEGKIWILEERYARRLELWNPKDRIHPESEAERKARLPKRPVKPEREPTPEELEAIEREAQQCREQAQQSQSLSLSSETSERKHPTLSPDLPLIVSSSTNH